ncbi:hypothetical protein [Streptomyces sp. DH10]|uniref:hypothetical protein n=1 Tax=Streptomyces sp. DH10 TaxID=3040121 RepID=UPI003FA79B8D
MREASHGVGEAGRLAGYDRVSTSLALCGDAELCELVDAAVPLGTGIGGKSHDPGGE